MRWNASESNPYGFTRHPRDGEAWKTFDQTHSRFASDPRNVLLGLASDGCNPFGTMRSTYSIWPVFLIPYNLPPWMCMKHTSFILSMIISGKQMPEYNIDVYLQPLVKELREVWNDGVETFDSSLNETFRMHATLMWTISDIPGLGYCKPYVWNKSQPEGCIAEGHIVEETLTFCSWYIEDIETRFNRPRRVRDEPTDMPSRISSLFPQLGKPASASENFPLNSMQKLQAHRCVLLDCGIVTQFAE
ncbi:hypothetical protein MTR67_002990 [Solanum verrucosum]|uniref:DUF4218 domain-containing protein n=1 Tax=Solanum verrucosum TaxID=315347 RepID=A0AAF0PTH1_SOLVR|nr:hypothetical protein MTR67_002990 [Solanum verrucosum]